ncbi:L-rhamnose mutarotase [Chryseobacterium taiwanense]|uniref:L-fucose mutarotase n=1 Tax=Chryseobacterium taiwanense TaxID=363331 RepID=A0A0B4DHZ2_9FLAO|nr:L-rhamnose mutarotase [Chryseobacterium taiwanense]KIC64055.1 L-fucose mutarotase [Chryseobacterium taiwanense]
MKKFCLALDLVDDEKLIAEYEKYHQNIWPEIKQSILNSGILNMEIYRIQNRLFMIVEADDNFSFEAKNEADKNRPKVQEWEELMWKFQQQLPNSKPGEKWKLMTQIFSL